MKKIVSNRKVLFLMSHDKLFPELAKSLQSFTSCHFTESGKEALALVQKINFDLILVEVGVGRFDGYYVCVEARNSQLNHLTPIIVLSARKEVHDKLIAHSLGADDFIQLPVDWRDLELRIQSNLGRPHSNSNDRQGWKEYGPLSLNSKMAKFQIRLSTLESKEIVLTKTELSLIEIFFSNPQVVLSRSKLLLSIRGDSVVVLDRTVDSHISKLRSKLNPFGTCIESVHGLGYRFNPNKLSGEPSANEINDETTSSGIFEI